MKKRLPLFLTIVLILCIASGLLFFAQKNHVSMSFAPAAFVEPATETENPGRGFYTLCGMAINAPLVIKAEDFAANSFFLLEVNLSSCRNESIPEGSLQNLDSALTTFEDGKKYVILRLLYDWDGKSAETEPDDLSTVLLHIEECAPVINAHKGIVYCTQGILLGDVGEMHGSGLMTEDSMGTIAEKLAECLDPAIPLSVRTPAQYRAIIAAHPDLADRIGLFNDGMFGSESDLGTYGKTPASADAAPGTAFRRADELAFQQKLCSTLPNGGEAVYSDEVSDPATILSDLRTMHVSYLNREHDAREMAYWKATPYSGDEAVWKKAKTSLYDYIAAHLSYRYVPLMSELKAVSWRFEGDPVITLTVRNTGFSSSYKDFAAEAVLVNTETGEEVPAEATCSTASWGGAPVSLTDPAEYEKGIDPSVGEVKITPALKNLPAGTYDVCLSLKDAETGAPVVFSDANAGETLNIGTFTLQTGLPALTR